MFKIVIGRSGSGKTTYVRELLGNKAKSGEDKLLLIVPEQFSYTCERALLENYGPIIGNKIEVLSFTRLTDFINRRVGGMNGVMLDDSDKIILLLHALTGIQDNLDFYKVQADKTFLSRDLITLFSEFNKQCIKADDLKETSNQTLNKKFKDIKLILDEYNSLLELNSYTDEDLIINQVLKAIRDNDIFSDYTICIDAFKGFTGQELAIINEFKNCAKELYITLPLDENENDTSMIFAAVKDVFDKIVDKDSEIIRLNGHRTEDKALLFLEKNLLTADQDKFTDETDSITLLEANTKYEECTYIAARIRKFMREDGLRLSDMAVVTRHEDDYKGELLAALSRFGIKVYEDKRQPVINQPLIIYCKALISLLSRKELSTFDLLAMLKTGLSGLSEDEALDLENYVFIWNIDGAEWEADFQNYQKNKDPGSETKAKKHLEYINKIRDKFITPILELKSSITPGCKVKSLDICREIYNYLEKINIKTALLVYARSIAETDFEDVATEQNAVWEIFVDVLNKLYTIQGDDPIDITVFYELFCAVCDMSSLGTLPHGIDELIIGSADRIRLASPKVVFVCGCVEGEFPENITSGTLLTSNDRKIINSELGLNLSLSNELAASDERFIAYSALTSSTEKLIVSYHTTEGTEDKLSPSCIFKDIEERFENVKPIEFGNLDAYFFSETEESSFKTYASGYHKRSAENIEQYNTIKEALKDSQDYEGKFEALDSIIKNEPKEIKDKDLAVKLFGEHMGLSASRIEVYHNCPFQYFCKHGIGAYPIRRVSLDNQIRGTVIHYVLEQILRNNDKTTFENMSDADKDSEISKYLEKYINENYAGDTLKDVTFNYKYNRLIKTIRNVIDRMCEEFKVSSFIPIEYEYEIKDSFDKADIKGDIDRVDKYVAPDGTTYIRVVDYKSYVKDFDLSNVVKGLNLQMLLYLFAAKKQLNATPAAVLYYKASDSKLSITNRDATDEDIKSERLKKAHSSGLFLDEEDVLNAIENKKAGVFYKFDENELASLAEFGEIETGVTGIVNSMVDNLQNGYIKVNPMRHDEHTGCDYCDYKNVCGFENEDELFNEVEEITKDEALDMLKGGNEID